MDAVVITTCSNRKRIDPKRDLDAAALQRGTLAQVADSWVERLEKNDKADIPGKIYCGRAYREAESAAKQVGTLPHVISAGLGLVAPEDEIPAYNLTLSSSAESCIFKKISTPISASEWWAELGLRRREASPLATLVARSVGKVVLIACSGVYFDLIKDDLARISDEDSKRVRIFGPQNRAHFSTAITDMLMPYDRRFDGAKSPNPGTRGDFPQRCLAHFVSEVLPLNGEDRSQEEDAQIIQALMESLPYPETISRAKKTDDEIRELIVECWERASGNSSKMLRVLRDDELVACEQGRFAKLFQSVKQECFI